MNNKKKTPPRYKRSFWRPANFNLEIRFTLLNLWLVLLALIISGTSTYLVVWSKLERLPFLSSPEELLVLEAEILARLAGVLSLTSLAVLLIAAVLIYRVMHRLTGPMLRMEREMKKMAAGQLPERPIILRQKDFFFSLAESFNTLVKAAREKENSR